MELPFDNGAASTLSIVIVGLGGFDGVCASTIERNSLNPISLWIELDKFKLGVKMVRLSRPQWVASLQGVAVSHLGSHRNSRILR
jgi:hypothetical protein